MYKMTNSILSLLRQITVPFLRFSIFADYLKVLLVLLISTIYNKKPSGNIQRVLLIQGLEPCLARQSYSRVPVPPLRSGFAPGISIWCLALEAFHIFEPRF
jgi:hypothetical protein